MLNDSNIIVIDLKLKHYLSFKVYQATRDLVSTMSPAPENNMLFPFNFRFNLVFFLTCLETSNSLISDALHWWTFCLKHLSFMFHLVTSTYSSNLSFSNTLLGNNSQDLGSRTLFLLCIIIALLITTFVTLVTLMISYSM